MSDNELISTVFAAFEQWTADLRASVATRSSEDTTPLSYNQQDAARMLGITDTALRDLRLRGEVEGIKLGKRIIYTRKSLERLLETKLKQSRAQEANSKGGGAP